MIEPSGSDPPAHRVWVEDGMQSDGPISVGYLSQVSERKVSISGSGDLGQRTSRIVTPLSP